jgi:uncharacterized OB-fold protein
MADDAGPADAGPAGAGPAGAGLTGSGCPGCGVVSYPAARRCPRCGAGMDAVGLSEEGTLWTWTVQRFAPKSPPYVPPPGGFTPFAVGYVELAEGIRIAAVLDVPDLGAVRIGMPLRLAPGSGVPRAVPAPGAGDAA